MAASNPPEAGDAGKPVPLIDLGAQQARLRGDIERAIGRVLDHGQFIMGPEVAELEAKLTAFAGVKHAVACASGTDALLIALMAKGIGAGDAVICPDFTFTATPEVVALLGASPVFADVREDTFNLDARGIAAAVATAGEAGLRPRAVMAVDLFGQPADYDAILAAAAEHGLEVLADSAQSFGASYRGRKVGQLGFATALSFFPAKPLGCYGDGGAILTDDDALAASMRSITLHGRGGDKYDIVRIGVNGRLDTLQAAILLEKLKVFPDEIALRTEVARRYDAGLAGVVAVPAIADGARSVYAQYTIRVGGGRRDAVADALGHRKIGHAVYYPRALHEQTAYSRFPVSRAGTPVATRLPREALSLPMHPYLAPDDQERVIEAVRHALGAA